MGSYRLMCLASLIKFYDIVLVGFLVSEIIYTFAQEMS